MTMLHRPHAVVFAVLLLSLSATTVWWSQKMLNHLTELETTETTMTLAALLSTRQPDHDSGVQVQDSVPESSNSYKRPWNQPDLTFTLRKKKTSTTALDSTKNDSMERDLPAKTKARHATDKTSTRKKMTTGKERIKQKKVTALSVHRDDRTHRNLPLCTRAQVGRGEWVAVRLDHAPYVTPTVHLRCYPREHYYGPFYDTWAWQPYAAVQVSAVKVPTSTVNTQLRLVDASIVVNEQQDDDKADGQEVDDGDDTSDDENENDNALSCEFTDWQPDLFCRLLPKATIAIVGDSLSWEHYSSLIQLLGLRTRQGYQHHSRELHTNIQQAVCNGETAVVYRRDDQLSQLPSVWQPHQEQQEHESTTANSHTSFPTVLILNRGAHYANDTMLLAGVRNNILQVGEWMQECRALGVDCHFFWRTSVPGHAGCDSTDTNENVIDYSRPVNDLDAIETRIANRTMYTEHQLKYHWYDYQHQNELVLSELAKSGLDYTVLDAYRLNVLRPDEHRSHQGDCLHNCYPGKMDVYNQLLLHFLRQRISAKSVQQTKAVARKQGWRTDVTTVYDKEATEEAKEKRLRKKTV